MTPPIQEYPTTEQRSARLPSLLFWQYALVFFVLGIVATRFMAFALCASITLVYALYFSYYHRDTIKDFITRIFLCVLCGISAFYYTPFISPQLQHEEKQIFDNYNNPMHSMYIEGTIIKAQALPYGRLRFFLKDVHPLTPYIVGESPEGIFFKNPPQIPRVLSLTWDRSAYFFERPVVGQKIIANTRIREAYGDIGEYWATKDVWYTGFIYKQEDIFWTGKGDFLDRSREILRNNFIEHVFIRHNTLLQKNNLTASYIKQELESTQNQARAILPALLFGDRFYLSEKSIEIFNSANLLHSLALSGQHLALATVLAGLLFSIYLLFRPQILNKIPRRRALFYLSLPFALFYVFIGSAPYSLLRALLMFLVAGIFWLRAHVITLLDCLFFALAFFVFLEPLSIFDLGVQLSFVSVFSIAFFMPFIRLPSRLFQKREKIIIQKRSALRMQLFKETLGKSTLKKQNTNNNFCKDFYSCLSSLTYRVQLFSCFLQRTLIYTIRAFCTLFLVSLCIQVTNFPILLTYFGKVSFFFLLNCIWLPLLAFIVLPFAAFALLFASLQIGLPTLMTNAFALANNFSKQTVPHLYSFLEASTQACITIACYPAEKLLELLLYLQNIGFDPYIQFLKPDKISILGFYCLLFALIYAQKHLYKQENSTKKHVNFQNIRTYTLHKENVAYLKSSLFQPQIPSIKIFLFCLLSLTFISAPFIQKEFFVTPHFSLTVFDVGQGQSILIQNALTEEGRILIDAGGSRSPRFNVGRDILAHKLTQNERPTLDYIIASHDDADHINGLPDLFRYFSISGFGETYVPQDTKSATRKELDTILESRSIPIEQLGMGDIVNLGDGFALQVLYPPYPLSRAKSIRQSKKYQQAVSFLNDKFSHLININNSINSNTDTVIDFNTDKKIDNTTATNPTLAKPQKKYSSNNSSLVLRLVKDGKGLALICGDVEKNVLEDLVEYERHSMWTYNPHSTHNLDTYNAKYFLNIQKWSLQADVLVLAHHGSKNSYLPNFYEVVNAHSVIASAGKYNRYGFPAQEIQDYFLANLQEKQNKAHIHNKPIYTAMPTQTSPIAPKTPVTAYATYKLPHTKIPVDFLVTANHGDILFTWNGKTLALQSK